MYNQFICQYCKESFDSERKVAKYCCKSCSAKGRKGMKFEEKQILCKHCGYFFSGRGNAKFCNYCRKIRKKEHNENQSSGVSWSLSYDPYKSPEFLKTWEGSRVPDFALGF